MAATGEKHEPQASESTPPPPPPVEEKTEAPPPPPPEKVEEALPPPLPPKSDAPPPPPPPAENCPCSIIDVGLRVFLFASTLVAVLVMVTSKQTEFVTVSLPRFLRVPMEAKFNHTPAFIYFVAAMCVTCLYSIITTLASISIILKPIYATSFLLVFIIWDVIFVGIVASATGAAAAVGYIGWKGNKHAQWRKVCRVFDNFCHHLAGSIPFGLVAAVILVFLVVLSVISIHKKIPK